MCLIVGSAYAYYAENMPRIVVFNALPETIALLSGDACNFVADTSYAGPSAIANRAPDTPLQQAKSFL